MEKTPPLGICFTLPTGGSSTTVSLIAAPGAVGILGGATTLSAIGIAVAAGGVGALNKLRKYRMISRENSRIVLKLK
jgi:hypothetical protein